MSIEIGRFYAIRDYSSLGLILCLILGILNIQYEIKLKAVYGLILLILWYMLCLIESIFSSYILRNISFIICSMGLILTICGFLHMYLFMSYISLGLLLLWYLNYDDIRYFIHNYFTIVMKWIKG